MIKLTMLTLTVLAMAIAFTEPATVKENVSKVGDIYVTKTGFNSMVETEAGSCNDCNFNQCCDANRCCSGGRRCCWDGTYPVHFYSCYP